MDYFNIYRKSKILRFKILIQGKYSSIVIHKYQINYILLRPKKTQ